MFDPTKYDPVIKTVLSSRKIGRGEKEDMTQECYLALLERQAELGGENDRDRATTVCRNRIDTILGARNQYETKKENRIRFVSADLPAIAHTLSKIGIQNQGTISESELYAAIDSLPAGERKVIRILFIEGLPQAVAAEKLNLTVDAIRWKKKCGIMKLRQWFEV